MGCAGPALSAIALAAVVVAAIGLDRIQHIEQWLPEAERAYTPAPAG
jgi:hypothetical protein